MSFRLVDHTADLAIEATGATRDEVLGEAALGLSAVLTGRDDVHRLGAPEREVRFVLEAPDADALAVAFLSELLWLHESEDLLWLGGGVKVEPGSGGTVRVTATGNQLNLAMRTATAEQYGQGGYGADIGGDIIGESPLVGVIDQAMIDENGIGKNGTGLAPAVFTGGTAGTEACVPGGGCTFATGATVNQQFSLYTHVFYGYMPPEGWRFSESSTVPAPPS